MELNKDNYQLRTDGNRLVFTTPSFRAEKSSVLPSGVYSKEFASMLLASAVCIPAYMATGFIGADLVILRYVFVVLLFVVIFLGARRFIFRERYLKLVLDRNEKQAIITFPGFFRGKTEKIPLSRIKSVEMGLRRFVPENIDGIKFVQRISSQHGSALPGLDDVEEFITLSLKLTDGTERIIYAGKTEEEPEMPVKEMSAFLERSH
ncbi:MAG: hypothetical protein GXP46_07400 [Deferribacteres bacterium]|nr:hypothetical protein [Deferribacteres bacterium]